MFDANENDPISPAMRALLEVFSTELSEVKFPDVDAEVLDEAAARVKAQAEAVAKAQAALEAARQALAESQEALQQKGQRALSYARVFAEEDAELSMKLEAISLPRPARKVVRPDGTVAAEAPAQNDESAPKRRGRPPKSRPSAPLFADGSSPEAIAAAEAAEAPVAVRTAAA
jgi:ATP-dependent Clp protease ATP-binding subunit ClpA